MGNVRMRAEQINYGASNVKVALDDLDPQELIALSARMDTIEAWKATVKTEEKTGASVEFTNALALPALSVSAEIEAIQDLHGYDKPWVGGAGKNLLPMTVEGIKAANSGYTWSGNSCTVSGITFTILTDSNGNVTGINVDGTSTAQITFFITKTVQYTSGTSYILDGCPSGGSLSSYLFYIVDNGEQYDTGSGVSFISSGSANRLVLIMVRSGITINNKVYYPMIRLSTASAGFEPYSNVCPITGFSSVVITNVDAESQTATVTVSLGSTVYGGTLNLTTGELTVTHANIASFNGETIGEPWISSMDEYVQGGTPTTGAQVVYTLASPTTTTLTAAQLEMVKGYNRISANSGDITVKAYTGAPWGGDTI